MTKRKQLKQKQNTKKKQIKGSHIIMNNITLSGVSYEESVQEPWFSLIAMGVKKIEGRPNKGLFKELKQGDIIIWTNNITGENRKVKTVITGVRTYKTFHNMITTEKLVNVLPATGAGIKTVDDGVNKVYRQWYNKEKEKTFGVCAIEMKVLD